MHVAGFDSHSFNKCKQVGLMGVLIRELKRAPKVGSEVRASVADCCSSLCTSLYHIHIKKGRNSAVNEDSSAF